MKLHFGQWLDGYIPHLPVGKAVMAEAWVGPRGLLERLEAAFGIDGPNNGARHRFAERVRRPTAESTVQPLQAPLDR